MIEIGAHGPVILSDAIFELDQLECVARVIASVLGDVEVDRHPVPPLGETLARAVTPLAWLALVLVATLGFVALLGWAVTGS